MTSPIEPRTASLYHASRAPAVEPGTAAAIVAAAAASYLVALALAPHALAFVVAQLTLVAATLTGVVVTRPARPLAAIGLRGARPRFFAAAIAIGATTWYVNAWLVSWLVRRLAISNAEIDHLQGLVEGPQLITSLAMFAVLPAICEELVFRGVLARSLGRYRSLAAAAAISGVVFAAYHLSLVQAVPTLTLGALLAVIAIRADSIAPSVVAHALNNAIAIAMSRGALPQLDSWLTAHPLLTLGGCTLAIAGGTTIAARGSA